MTSNVEIEALAARFHDIYQREAHRRGDIRHAENYADLSEATKEWDRVLARWVLAHFEPKFDGDILHQREIQPALQPQTSRLRRKEDLMPRRMSDYQVFVSARMRALAPQGLDESRRAMRQVAAEWRAMQNGGVARPAASVNPRAASPRRRLRVRRDNPGGPGLMPLALAGLALWLWSKRRAA